MKKRLAVLSALLITVLLLRLGSSLILRRWPLVEQWEPNGVFGTVQTAMEAAELDGVLYLRYPVGPVYAPAGVAAYDPETGRFWELPGLPETDILGLCPLNGDLVLLTEDAVYRYDLLSGSAICLTQTEGREVVANQWLTNCAEGLILCRDTVETEEDVRHRSQLLRLTADGMEELLWEDEATLLFHPAMTCCWERALYGRKVGDPVLRVLDLETGEMRELPQAGAVTELYVDSGGVVLETEDDGQLRYLDGSLRAETPAGVFLGCGGQNAYYLESRYGTRSRLYRVGAEAPLAEAFESDLVTEPQGYVAGAYALFYTPEVLDGEEKRDAWVHHLYLLEDGRVRRIASYTQDYPYV